MVKFKQIRFLFNFCQTINSQLLKLCFIKSFLVTIQPFLLLYFVARLIDSLASGVAVKQFSFELIFMFMGLGLTKILLIAVTYYYNININLSGLQSGNHFAKQLMKMPYPKFESGEIRDKQSHAQYHLYASALFLEILEPLMVSLAAIGIYGLVILKLSGILLLAISACILLKYYLLKKRAEYKQLFDKKEASFMRRQDALFTISTSLEWAKDIRINNLSSVLDKNYRHNTASFQEGLQTFNRQNALITLPLLLMEGVSLLIQYGYIMYKMISDQLAIGNFTLLIGSVANYSGALNTVIEKWAEFATVLNAVETYQNLLLEIEEPSKQPTTPVSLSQEGYVIKFENVSFRYPDAAKFSLKNVTLTISNHEQLAIVGFNGAGKTTIIKLLCQLYEPTEGRITFNGVDISSFKQDDWLKQLGTVLQDFQIFALPLWQNICLNKSLNSEKLHEILRESGLDNKLATLENGLNQEMTKSITDEGIELSGGENQKLASARALYQDAPVVLLDEPTSALDPIAESKLFQNFQHLTMNKNSLYITHRLAAVRFCDKIAVMNQGELEEYGTHDELMKYHGLYYEMFSKQAKYYVDEVPL